MAAAMATRGCCRRRSSIDGTGPSFETTEVPSNEREKENRIPAHKRIPGWPANVYQAWATNVYHLMEQVARKGRPYRTPTLGHKRVPDLDQPLGWRVGGVI